MNPRKTLPAATASAVRRGERRGGRAHAAPSACAKARATSPATSFWTPDQVGRFYRVNDLFAAGLTGKGKTIALLELGRAGPSDTNHYLSCFGLHNTRERSSTSTAARSADAERHARSRDRHPGSGDASAGRDDHLVRSAEHRDRRVRRVQPDRERQQRAGRLDELGQVRGAAPRRAQRRRVHQRAAHAVPAGRRAGSDACSRRAATPVPKTATTARPTPPSETLQVDNPADDPFVTGVGGTALEEPGVEPVWNDCGGSTGDSCAASGSQAGGGGQSTHLQAPEVAAARAERDVPDVPRRARHLRRTPASARRSTTPTSDPAPNRWTAVGGTSIAAPMMAGIVADIAQGCTRRADRRLRAEARRARGEARVRHRAHRRHDRHQLDQLHDRDARAATTSPATTAARSRPTKGFDLATGLGVPIASGLACPQITSMTPNHGKAGHARDAARRRPREGDDQVRLDEGARCCRRTRSRPS